MIKLLLPATTRRAIPIHCVDPDGWASRAAVLDPAENAAAGEQGFSAGAGRTLLLTGKDGRLARVLFGLGKTPAKEDPFLPGTLARTLPPAAYRFEGELPRPRLAVLGWLLEAYAFSRYRRTPDPAASLVCPKDLDRDGLIREAEAVYLARDLINTPASDLGPRELEAAVRAVAKQNGARVAGVSGKALIAGFPMISAVGRAATPERAPRLIDLRWGPQRAPAVTLIGKGVCFDTGGLDVKTAAGMLIMKKDMGGAANVLALAQMIMASKLPLRLRVLIPAVENAISADAFRPGDILRSRKGLSVEIGNTDAEGRLILADALRYADEERPDLIIDMATLTGAARVALGPDLPPFYTDDDGLADELLKSAAAENDPLWRMPFWTPYERFIESKFADINNASESGYAGSVLAALFLRRFVDEAKTYLHMDIFGWTPAPRPGRPFGGEAQGIRALFALLRNRYAR
ncbi:MAG TPA: leucyl aminopeptidase family protein [Aestuariivirgaceae bacterium]|nr:leucyl aminopeptidase family protein [Aestuariivirgaceae bacterium]